MVACTGSCIGVLIPSPRAGRLLLLKGREFFSELVYRLAEESLYRGGITFLGEWDGKAAYASGANPGREILQIVAAHLKASAAWVTAAQVLRRAN